MSQNTNVKKHLHCCFAVELVGAEAEIELKDCCGFSDTQACGIDVKSIKVKAQ